MHLDTLSGMDTEQAELFATIHAVWDELLKDGVPVCDEAMIAGVHAWHPEKEKFTDGRIVKCRQWMSKHGWEPAGFRFDRPVAGGMTPQRLAEALPLFAAAVEQPLEIPRAPKPVPPQ